MADTLPKVTTKQMDHPFLMVYRELADLADGLPRRSKHRRHVVYLLGRLDLRFASDQNVVGDPCGQDAKAITSRVLAARSESRGYDPIHYSNRRPFTYSVQQWRKAVLARDGHRCVECGATSNLQAHHIRQWSEFPELRFDLSNGKTLCLDCHCARHPSMAGLMRSRLRRVADA